jgi:hypothetical protein
VVQRKRKPGQVPREARVPVGVAGLEAGEELDRHGKTSVRMGLKPLSRALTREQVEARKKGRRRRCRLRKEVARDLEAVAAVIRPGETVEEEAMEVVMVGKTAVVLETRPL